MKKGLFSLLLGLLLSFIAQAENSTKTPGYTIHHNAIPTAILTPEIASSYGITRSKYRGLLNISVIKDVPGTTGKAVPATVEAYTFNLIGQIYNIKLRRVEEGEAIYYIGDFPIVDAETLKIRLEVRPEGAARSVKTEISQQFFVD